MNLCKGIFWDRRCRGVQYSRIKEVDSSYDFLAGLNSKFDLVHGRILSQRSILSLMEMCSKVCLEEDHERAMNIITVLSIDFAAFSAKSNSDSDKQNRKPFPICEYCKKL